MSEGEGISRRDRWSECEVWQGACCLPEEVVPTEEFSFAGEALVRKSASAVSTAYAFGMPCPVQHRKQKFVHNGFFTASTANDHGGG